MANRHLVDITCQLVDEHERSYIITQDGGKTTHVVGKSVGEWNPESDDGVDGVMTMPRWLAEKEGLDE